MATFIVREIAVGGVERTMALDVEGWTLYEFMEEHMGIRAWDESYEGGSVINEILAYYPDADEDAFFQDHPSECEHEKMWPNRHDDFVVGG